MDRGATVNEYLAMKLHEAKQQDAERHQREEIHRQAALVSLDSRQSAAGVFARVWAQWTKPQRAAVVKPTRATQTLRTCPQAGTIKGKAA